MFSHEGSSDSALLKKEKEHANRVKREKRKMECYRPSRRCLFDLNKQMERRNK